MALTDFLHLPPSVSRSRESGRMVFVCTVPGCRAAFSDDNEGKFTRHVAQCAKENSDAMEEMIAKHHSTYFTKPADEEMYAHFREGGN
jgi:hypothetical protein